jgi:hypothetical protein
MRIDAQRRRFWVRWSRVGFWVLGTVGALSLAWTGMQYIAILETGGDGDYTWPQFWVRLALSVSRIISSPACRMIALLLDEQARGEAPPMSQSPGPSS